MLDERDKEFVQTENTAGLLFVDSVSSCTAPSKVFHEALRGIPTAVNLGKVCAQPLRGPARGWLQSARKGGPSLAGPNALYTGLLGCALPRPCTMCQMPHAANPVRATDPDCCTAATEERNTAPQPCLDILICCMKKVFLSCAHQRGGRPRIKCLGTLSVN